VNTITNGLFFSAVTQLARLPSVGPAYPLANVSLLTWAYRVFDWITQPVVSSPAGIFWDGVTQQNCSESTGQFWTYNQGIWLDGLTSLSILTSSSSYQVRSAQLAEAAQQYFQLGGLNDLPIMIEKGCSVSNGWCNVGGEDGRIFKGVYARHLMYAIRDWIQLGSTSVVTSETDWILNNFWSLLGLGSSSGASGQILFGQLWQGPFQSDNTPWVTHSAGFDLLLACLDITTPPRGKPVNPNVK